MVGQEVVPFCDGWCQSCCDISGYIAEHHLVESVIVVCEESPPVRHIEPNRGGEEEGGHVVQCSGTEYDIHHCEVAEKNVRNGARYYIQVELYTTSLRH